MGKKYIYVQIAARKEKLYLANVKKVHKRTKKVLPPIPIYSQKLHDHIDSQETEPDSHILRGEDEEGIFDDPSL